MTTQTIKTGAPNGLLAAVISVAVALAVGAVGGFATASSVTSW